MKNHHWPRRLGVWALTISLGLLAFGGGVVGAEAAPKPDKPRLAMASDAGKLWSTVTGTTTDGRTVKARFVPTSVDSDGSVASVTGTVKGVVQGKGAFAQTVTAPIESVNGVDLASLGDTTSARRAALAAPACDVLNLVLGPLDLNVLGLEVHLDKVVLDIVAQSGAGNLLGNLLCAVAGLLDGGGLLSTLLGNLSDLLNQILGALGGLGL
ncbi:hypothetical protein [Nocardioides marmoribigeumensis]|uniref:ABC transporter substrate-binding protein n=1 Tax=Nocardioides marmoribigeumensis TaxID=433649 RepID=A0ABU2C026_9ACTN|nr:hypothetical protein [Nocardioides marmoribigeumensis]MDR7363987.1 hypothetical protein [Nocardioides marmoribigeumensis]